jgi:hypothetical protein
VSRKKNSDVMDIESHVRRLGGGRYAIAEGSAFDALSSGQFQPRPGAGFDFTHRNWQPVQLAAEMGSFVNIVSEQAMEVRALEFRKDALQVDLLKPVSEMITTSQGAMDLLEKVRIDVDFGLAEVPLLYGPIYERVNGPFPGGAVQIGPDLTLDANVVFAEKMEGGEIIFGTLAKAGAPTLVPILTYAAGFEWTEDMIEYDRTWEIGMNSRAFGRSYNYLLNHLHLSPILAYSYAGDNLTAADATAGASLQEKTLRTFQSAYMTAVQDIPQRVPTVILANEANRFQIEDALLTPVLDAVGNPLRRVPVSTIIYYNGATVTNGVKQYLYPGVTAGTVYFIAPRQRFKELVHHDLRVDIGPEDLSRLIEGQQVARTRRNLYADMLNSVQKITLP